MPVTEEITLQVTWDTTTDDFPNGDPDVSQEERVSIPAEIYLRDKANDFQSDYVSDYLSGISGWCVRNWIEA
jgi:hypothetical protein